MLKFTSKGLLQPNLPIPSNIEELKNYFVDQIPSTIRQHHFERYIKYSDDLKASLGGKPIKQWINGSFTSKRVNNPKDIDLVTFIGHEEILELGESIKPFTPSQSWDIYEVDAYIVETHNENSNLYYFSQSDKAYWLEQFGKTKSNRRGFKESKGFLEIIY